MAHRFFGLFLLLLALTAAVVLTLNGWDYYFASAEDRVFMPEHRAMRPSGDLSHGLGIIGATMITVGVVMYSTRKRVNALWNLGKLSVWLEIHITLCLLGPILVLYHSTFKSGGIAAISLWAMLSVAGSGIIGRFLYVWIPRASSNGAFRAKLVFRSITATKQGDSYRGNHVQSDLYIGGLENRR